MGELCKSCWTDPAELCMSCLEKMVGNLRNRLITEDIQIQELQENQKKTELRQEAMERRLEELEENMERRLKELEESLAIPGLNEEEIIASMTGLVLQFLKLNELPSPGYGKVEALAKRLYRRAVTRGME